MAVSNVTIRAVQALKPDQTIWDAGHREAVRGFGARRQRDAVAYFIKYRAHGRQRFYTIGVHGSPWTPEKARREAKRLLGSLRVARTPPTPRRKPGWKPPTHSAKLRTNT